MVPSSTYRRLLPAISALVGLGHLLFPDRLLATAGRAYDRTLAVDFDPRRGATRRVRLVGLLFVAASLLAWRRSDS